MQSKVTFVVATCLVFAAVNGQKHSEDVNLRNALKVRFNVFQDVPRTEAEALDAGFVQTSNCSTGYSRGKQYMKNGDPAVIPLYDANGYIAGLQTGVSVGLDNGYPPSNMQPPFILDGNFYKLTAYFIHPSLICHGRSEQQFRRTGTGQDLFIQTGHEPETDLMEIIEHETETNWVKGLCFPKMGFHYFKEVSIDMSCADFYPVALLYYEGRLQGFVWSFGAILNSTYISYEYPEPEFFEELLHEVPTCLNSLRRSTLHVYFRDNIDKFTCEFDTSASPKVAMSTMGRCFLYVLAMAIISIWK